MSERGRASVRLTTGLALLIVALVEFQALAAALQAQSRLREKVTRTIRVGILAARPRLAELLRPGGRDAWLAAVREARSGLAAEAAVLDFDGRVLAAEPAPPNPLEELTPADWDLLGAEGTVTVGPILGEASRQLTYLGQRSGDQPVALRLATPVPELVLDLRERRPLLIAHGVALTLLAVAAALLLFPGPFAPSSGSGATLAYEAAMARLHERTLQSQDELRRVEEELREKAALARSGELAAGIAHEMRNGLGTILGYARLVERIGTSEATDAARAIREECETLEVVIRRFTEFVKDETLNVARFDLHRMLSRVVARESRRKPGVHVAVSGGSGEPQLVEGDEELLERAFENLVRNALDAVAPDGQVGVDVARTDPHYFVSVEDDGPGLSSANFNPRAFFSSKPGGLGLGLPIAMKIVRLHGGDLTLHPREPRGLLVRVQLAIVLPDVTRSVATATRGSEGGKAQTAADV
jgi:signal transduction histidine kinase